MLITVRNPMLVGFAAVLMWSTVAVGFKLGLRSMEPIQLLWIGCCFSWVLFSICCVVLPSQPRATKHAARASLLGLLNPLLYYIVLLTAYDLLPAHVAQPLNYTWAIVTALLAIPMLRQKLNRSTLIGILVGYFGVLLLVTKGQLTSALGFDPVGIGLALASTLVWAIYWIWSVTVRLEPWWFMWYGFTVAVPLLTILCYFTEGFPRLIWSNFGYGAWIGLLEMGFAFLLWQRAMSTTSSVATLSQLIFLSPMISLILIYTILGESIHYTAFIGICMIFLGLYVVNRQRVNDRTDIVT
ncbi:MAG: DMT family transporter [Gammaproteobacteria bacterium]|nr:DMT family transporter [Gammaproteobacteria bacterium]